MEVSKHHINWLTLFSFWCISRNRTMRLHLWSSRSCARDVLTTKTLSNFRPYFRITSRSNYKQVTASAARNRNTTTKKSLLVKKRAQKMRSLRRAMSPRLTFLAEVVMVKRRMRMMVRVARMTLVSHLMPNLKRNQASKKRKSLKRVKRK